MSVGMGAAGSGGGAGMASGSGGGGFAGFFGAIFGSGNGAPTLHNYTTSNNNAEQVQDDTRADDDDARPEKEENKGKSIDTTDQLTLSDELLDEMDQDDPKGKRPTSIWPPRRT